MGQTPEILIRHHTDDCACRLLQSTQEDVVTRFTTPFGFHTTAAEVVAGIDLTGKKAIVTGGAGGIGAETARALADLLPWLHSTSFSALCRPAQALG